MSMVDRLKVIVSGLVILGFVGIFGWAFYTTWTKGPDIAKAQKLSDKLEEDRSDALDLFEAAKAEAAKVDTQAAQGDLARSLSTGTRKKLARNAKRVCQQHAGLVR